MARHGNEPELLDGLGGEHVGGREQVADVGRVEAAAEERDLHGFDSTSTQYSTNVRRRFSNAARSASQAAHSCATERPASTPARNSALPVSRSIAGMFSTNSYFSVRQPKREGSCARAWTMHATPNRTGCSARASMTWICTPWQREP